MSVGIELEYFINEFSERANYVPPNLRYSHQIQSALLLFQGKINCFHLLYHKFRIKKERIIPH